MDLKILLCVLVLLVSLAPVYASSITVEKAIENQGAQVGDEVRVILNFVNPFSENVSIQVTDKNVIGRNGLDIHAWNTRCRQDGLLDLTTPSWPLRQEIIPLTEQK